MTDLEWGRGNYVPWAVVALILVMRRPDALYNAQFWAEDATVFFKSAFDGASLGSLFQPYAGYFHVVPRLVAWVTVRLVEPEWAPLMFNAFAIAIAAWCVALFSARTLRYLVPSDTARLGACILVAAAHPATEIINSLTNVHWYMTIGSLLLLMRPVTSIAGTAGAAAALMLAGLSCPLNPFLTPLALVILFARRDLRLPAAVLLVSVAVHVVLIFMLVPAGEARPLHVDPARIVTHVLTRLRDVILYASYGHTTAGWIVHKQGSGAWWIAGVNASLVLAFLIAFAARRQVRAVLAAVGLACLWLAAHVVAGLPDDPSPSQTFFNDPIPLATRFAFMPYCMAVFAMACVWDAAAGVGRESIRRLGKAACLVVLICGVLGGLRNWPFKDLEWRSHVRAARRAGWHADIPVNPPSWTLRLRGRPDAAPVNAPE